MNFEDQKETLEVTGTRCYPTLSICERVITDYNQLDRFIEILSGYRKSMRDGKPAEKEYKVNFTI